MFFCAYSHIHTVWKRNAGLFPTFRFSLLSARISRDAISKLDGLGIEVLLNHKRYLKGDSVLKFTQVKSCHLADLVQTVNERITVYEELTGGFGNVEVVLKERLNGLQRFTVERLEATALEYLLQKHFAKCGGQLIDQTANAEILIADDVLFVLKNLADLK